MDTRTKLVYTAVKRNTFKYKKSFFIRCGVLIILLLTFYVLLTFYNQLRQASELLMEIKQRHIASNTNTLINWRENVKPDKTASRSEFDNIFADLKNAQNDSEFGENMENDIGQAIRRRFQENVYMIRKRFYESNGLQTSAVQGQGNKKDLGIDLDKIDREIPHTRETRVGYTQIPREIRVEKPEIPRGLHAEIQDTPSVSRDPRVDDTRETRVIIVAYHRSGSSFLGEMFNRDPRGFYLFEPIHTIDSFLDARRRFPILYDTLIRNLLDTIFKCDFNKHPLFVGTLTASAFRLKSEALTSHGLCDPRASSYKMHLCQRINATLLTKLCRARPLTVVKTIRMVHWENLDFLSDGGTSFKVIHLVRDPRGIITSRVSWLLERLSLHRNASSHTYNATRSAIEKYVRMISKSLCKEMADDINDWTKRANLGKPYAMVRYEDVAKEPLTVYKEISEFAGLTQSKVVIGWLKNNTKCTSDSNYYSTTRNSSAVPHRWRRRLTMPLVKEMQSNCAKVMGIMGYKLVHSEKELRDFGESLVTDWGNKKLLRTKPYMP